MSEGAGGDVPSLLLRFIDRFDRGEYWLAHEELEDLWLQRRDDSYKGLIHLAAALVHVERGNWRGAATTARSAVEYLRAVPAGGLSGFETASLLQCADRLLGHLEALADGEAERFDEGLRPKLRPLFQGDVPEGIAEHEELPYRVRRHEQGYRLGRDPRDRD